MKPDYKNWMPKGMVFGFLAATGVALLMSLVFGMAGFIGKILLVIGIFLAIITIWMFLMYRAFSYNGSRQMSKQIIEGVSSYVKIPDGGKGLDVGCGSGALTIACAKKNPNAQMVGIDRWGKEYASFSKTLCESNAKAEGTVNVTFDQGDATKLDTLEDNCFDLTLVFGPLYHLYEKEEVKGKSEKEVQRYYLNKFEQDYLKEPFKEATTVLAHIVFSKFNGSLFIPSSVLQLITP